ncbi:MAG TPA: hypothetical protein VI653_19290 [Steroidobacteraceae bacterium]
MSFKSEAASSFANAVVAKIGTKYSYSRKRPDGFSAWQEHLRKSVESLGNPPVIQRDRDLRRTVVPG